MKAFVHEKSHSEFKICIGKGIEVDEMRKYSLASSQSKECVDLRDYKDLIEEAVHSICGKGVKVNVVKDGYLLPESITRGDKIRIGRYLAASPLGTHCINRPILFIGKDIDKKQESKKTKKKKQEELL